MYNFDKESATLLRKLKKMTKEEGMHYASLACTIRAWKAKAWMHGVRDTRIDPIYCDALRIQADFEDGQR